MATVVVMPSVLAGATEAAIARSEEVAAGLERVCQGFGRVS